MIGKTKIITNTYRIIITLGFRTIFYRSIVLGIYSAEDDPEARKLIESYVCKYTHYIFFMNGFLHRISEADSVLIYLPSILLLML